MDQAILQDRITRALGAAARAVGASSNAYRPNGAYNPLSTQNRYLRLPAAFAPPRGFTRANAYGEALWHGVFDAAYTRIGDYIAQPSGTWFIADQAPLLPVLCVLTTRTVAFARPAAPSAAGVNAYGGVTLSAATPLLSAWPASVLGAAGAGAPSAGLPNDTTTPYWTVLLPASVPLLIRTGDIMSDDLGRTAIVAAAELTGLGWRITVRQAIT